MHIDKKVYKIDSDLNVKIVQISDIHFSLNYNLKRLDKIFNNICEIDPDYICIVGDLIDSYNSVNIDYFKEWLKKLSSVYKVLIVLGNHDYIAYNNGVYVEHKDISWLESIKSTNLIVLSNSVYSENGINFIGYSLDYNYYYNHEKPPYDFYNYDISKLILSVSSGYNILLIHSPYILSNNDNYKNIKCFKKINLVLCGHMHGGLVPSFIPGNFGFVSPKKKLFPKNVRGKIILDNTILIISSGIVKLSEKSGLSFFNNIYGYNINVIDLFKKC